MEKPLDGFYKHKQTKDGLETTCKDCKKLAADKWSKENKEQRLINARAYTERHPGRRKETLAKYYQANKRELNKRVKASRSRNPGLYAELGRTHANRRRARKLENGFEPYTESQVLELYGTCCHLCGNEIDLNAPRQVGAEGWELGLHIDHLVPISKGGADSLDNVKPSHGKCNLDKGSTV